MVPERTLRVSRWAPFAAAAATGAAALALHLRDPHVEGSWGLCPLKVLTGLDCPGCGGLRAVHLLTDGDLVGAASSNLVLVVALPFVVVLWLVWVRRAGTGRPVLPGGPSTSWLVTGAVLLVLFTVVRNLPVGAWLAA